MDIFDTYLTALFGFIL